MPMHQGDTLNTLSASTVQEQRIGGNGPRGLLPRDTTLDATSSSRWATTMTRSTNSTRTARTLAAINAVAGVTHFVRPEPFDSLIPRWLPGKPRHWTYASGVAELASAALLSRRGTRRIGGLLTTGLYAVVWPGNMQMVANWRDKPWPLQAIAWARLPLQLWLLQQARSVAKDDGDLA